jgi:hypothetical protein
LKRQPVAQAAAQRKKYLQNYGVTQQMPVERPVMCTAGIIASIYPTQN